MNTKKAILLLSFITLFATSGLFVAPSMALAAATVTPADGGTNISIDTTSGGGSEIFSDLGGPVITETAVGDIAADIHTITLPSGWEFNTSSNITISKVGNIVLGSTSVTPNTNSFSFVVSSQSTSASVLIFSGLKVRPTGITPSSGNMTYSGAGIAGVVDGSTNFGTLTSIPGTFTQLAFTTQPGNAVYGSLLSSQPVVVTRDQFNNNSTNGLEVNKTITLALTSGTGALQGATSLDIGTAAGNGTVTFTDLKVGDVGAVGTKGLTASATDLANAVSDNFEITKKPLTATVTVNAKDYDGNDSATITGITLDGIVTWDVTLDDVTTTGGTAIFASANAGTHAITASGVTLDGTDKDNYTLDNADITGTGTIDPLEITITPTAGQTKIYGQADPAFAYTNDPLVGTDGFTGALDRATGENVGTYAITQGNLSAGNNYNITFVADNFSITKRPITVEASASSKEYDGTTTSAGIPTITTGTLATGDSVNFIQVYSTTNVNTGKRLTPSGTAGGNSGNNYEYTFTYKMNGTITEKELIVSGLSVLNKVYDGNINTTVNGTPSLVGVVGTDVVSVAGTATGSFNDANVGNRTVAITGLSLTGTAMGNYTLIQPVLSAEILQLEITGSFTADDKVYNGNTIAAILTQSLTGVLPGDVGNVVLAGGTASFADKNVADGITVTASGMTLSGSASGNYSLTGVDTTSAKITKAPLTITAENKSKVYGDANPTLTASYVGFVAGENASVLDTPVVIETIADATSPVGDYPITASGATDANYDINHFPGTLTVTTAPLTVTADAKSKTYGDADPGLTYQITSGSLLGGDILTGLLSRVAGENVGDHPISSTLDNSNYNITFTPANLTINKKPITVTAVTHTKTYDGNNSAGGTPTFTGSLVGTDVANFTETYDNKNVGTNKVLTPSGIVNDGNGGANYNYNFVTDTTGEITRASLTITAEGKSKVYGDANPTLTASYVGFVGGDTSAVLTTPVSLSTIANTASPVGNYPITDSGATDINYDISFFPGTLTVTPAPLTVTADDKFKEYGASDPTLTYTYSGLVNNDTVAVFSGALTRVTGEAVGTYPINQGTLSASGNYNIAAYVPGTLTIKNAPTIISHTPSLNALNISPTTPIVVTFSEPVNVEIGNVSFSPAISSGFAITNSGTSVVTITPNNPLADNTTYTITLAGVADINGISLPTYSNIKFTTATTYSINLNANASGWNLISLPVIPTNPAIATVLGSAISNINAVWTYDPTDPNDVNGWLVYTGNPATSNLDTMTAGFGYWVSVTGNTNLSGAGTLLIAGPIPPPSRSLQTGWNLVGYYQLPGESNSTPTNAFASLTPWSGLWGFNNTTGIFNSVTTINPGDGFWISLTGNKVYTPSN